jgi:hypothetical protein
MRMQIDLDEGGTSLFQYLQSTTGCASHKELLNNAISLLLWAVRQHQQGRTVASLDEEKRTYKHLDMPLLNQVNNELKLPEEAANQAMAYAA